MMTIRIDNEFRDLLPPLTPDERQALENALLTDGCLSPLIVWEGTLLDGHNRYEICLKHSIPYEVKEIALAGRIEALEWIIANQDARRNLNTFARSVAVLKCAKAVEEIREKSRGLGNSKILEKTRTLKELSGTAKVSTETVRKARLVLERAPLPVIMQAQTGKLSAHHAYEVTKLLQTAPEKVSQIVAKHELTDIATLTRLSQLAPNSETLTDVLQSGYIDTGDGQVAITAPFADVDKAIRKRAETHRHVAGEASGYRRNPEPKSLILYDTTDLTRTAEALVRHYGDRLGGLVDELQARLIMAQA